MKRKKGVLVIGELIIDIYHHGTSLGAGPDSSAPLGIEKYEKISYGGAGLVVNNLLVLRNEVVFITLTGSGAYASHAKSFRHALLTPIFLNEPKRPTTVKRQFLAEGKKLLYWQSFDNKPIGKTTQDRLLTALKNYLPQVEKVVIADYRHGLLPRQVASSIVALCKKANVPLYVDSQIVHERGNHKDYKGAYLFTLNQKEACHVSPSFNEKDLKKGLSHLKKLLLTENVVVKLGAKGSVALLGTTFIRTSSHNVTALDTTGAGDAFLAALSIGNSPPSEDDLKRANTWAALATRIIGTEPPKLNEFKKA